jgi:hypothetical protein
MFVGPPSFNRKERLTVTDRETELRKLAEDLADRGDIRDAFVAKSFTDRLVIVDTPRNQSVPEDARDRLAAHQCYGSESVYGDEARGPDFAGDVGDATRHHFVDIETRGSHQSYVVE